MNEYVIPFGKYQDEDIRDVIKEDRQYIEWLYEQDFVAEKFERLWLAIDEVFEEYETAIY